MSRLRKYPGESADGPAHPFRDAQAANPFADREPAPGESGPILPENAYYSGAGGLPAHQIGGFQTTLPHRGGSVLIMGLLGIFGAALFSFCFPLLLVNLFLTVPAWLRGRADLRAMQAGAMDPEGRRMTRAGHVLGIFGTVGTLILFVVIAWTSYDSYI